MASCCHGLSVPTIRRNYIAVRAKLKFVRELLSVIQLGWGNAVAGSGFGIGLENG